PAFIALPPAHEVGPGVRRPHELARCVEGSRDADFAIAGQCDFCGPWHGLLLGASSWLRAEPRGRLHAGGPGLSFRSFAPARGGLEFVEQRVEASVVLFEGLAAA